MIIQGIDPGPEYSGVCVWCTKQQKILFHDSHRLNDRILSKVVDISVIEDIKSYGMAVGESVFSTCKQIGRLQERLDKYHMVYKADVQLHFCRTTKAKDTNIKRVLLDRFGGKGTKKSPGTLYGLKTHAWDAFALCLYYQDNYSQGDLLC